MTTHVIVYPKWVGKLLRAIDKICIFVLVAPLIFIDWLREQHIEFKEKQEPRP